MYSLIIVDALSLLFRSFYALNEMRNSKSLHIGGVYGFTNQLLNLINQYRPTHLVIAFDSPDKTWRHSSSEEYKANRKETPTELLHQFDIVKEICLAFGVKMYQGMNHEADDWIASCAEAYKEQVNNIYIVSTDKDLLQLVNDKIYAYDPFAKVLFKTEEVIKKWGVKPKQIIDLLSLTGDSCDGIRGIKGIGPKTAAAWLNQYVSLEGLIENICNVSPKHKQKLLEENYRISLEGKKLIQLINTLPVEPIETATISPNIAVIEEVFIKYEINLVEKLHRVIGRNFKYSSANELFPEYS